MLDNEIAGRIVQYIVDKRLSPGSKLPSIREFAASWGCNPSQIRTGLITLSAMGVIDMHSRAGSFVKQLTPHDMDALFVLFFRLGMLGSKSDTINFYEVKTLLDLHVFPNAARYRTDRDIYDLDLIVARQRRMLEEPLTFIDEDEAFHKRMAKIIRNPLIEFLLDVVQGMIRPYRRENMTPAICRAAFDDHTAVMDAIRDGDAGTAERIASVHSKRRLQLLELERAAFDQANSRS